VDIDDWSSLEFDKQIISVIDYKYKFFFNQRMISKNQKSH